MNSIFILFLSMSVSGSMMILGMFFLKPLFRSKISRQWQYYVWLIVIARLLLPITPGESLVGNLFRWAGQASSWLGSAIVYDDDESLRTAPQGDNLIDDTMLSLTDNEMGSGIFSHKDTLSEVSASALDGKASEVAKLLRDGNVPGTAGSQQDGNVPGTAGPPQEDNVSGTVKLLQGGNVFENAEPSVWENIAFGFGHLWILWLAGVLILSVRKLTVYQSYTKYVKAGCREVEDMALLDLLAREEERAGVKRPMELYVNSMVSSPMLLGLFHPCIILPTTDLPQEEFFCTVRHELIHYKRWDMLYKWLVQITVCLHWFNPLVYLMGRELGQACELSCDEAVIRSLDQQNRRSYGDTLLHAVRSGGKYRESFTSVLLGESAELLRERLDAIMKYKKMSKKGCCGALLVSAALASVFVVSGAYAAESAPGNGTAAMVPGIAGKGSPDKHADEYYGVDLPQFDDAFAGLEELSQLEELSKLAWLERFSTLLALVGDGCSYDNFADPKEAATAPENVGSGSSDKLADEYYGVNLPQFGYAFAALDENAQAAWLERIYNDGEIAFFSVSLQQLDMDSSLITVFAQKAYDDGKISFFSVLADHMGEKTLEAWLDKAKKEKQVSFQSVILKALDRDWELEALEEELERQRLAEYENYGITRDGKVYYYQGQMVNIFMDHQSNSAFYTLDMNPNGAVNIKIVRGEDGSIQSVDYMTESEVEELFGDM